MCIKVCMPRLTSSTCKFIQHILLSFLYIFAQTRPSLHSNIISNIHWGILAMASLTNLLSFSLCLLVVSRGCVVQFWSSGQSPWQSSHRFGPDQRTCCFEQLSAVEPSRRVQSEAWVTEYYEESNEQLHCAGLSALQCIIEPRGLRQPIYSNTPSLVYIKEGQVDLSIASLNNWKMCWDNKLAQWHVYWHMLMWLNIGRTNREGDGHGRFSYL
jgi:Cupin